MDIDIWKGTNRDPMCCRYYIDTDTTYELNRTANRIDQSFSGCKTGDICPSDFAPVLSGLSGEKVLSLKRWGYLSAYNRGLVINARYETVTTLPMFRNGFQHRRIVIPAAGFYEWNPNREKNTFRYPDSNILYMAGICDRFNGEDRFVILTTAANSSMKPVHDRMPLILKKSDLADWLFYDTAAKEMLHHTPMELIRESDYEQLSLF